jgi:membrane protein implicated in regulation of membrane protease activity
MKKFYDKEILRETLIIIGTGTIINYPIGILFAWMIIGVWNITNPVMFATLSTIGFFIVSFIRVYVVRYLSEQRKRKRKIT